MEESCHVRSSSYHSDADRLSTGRQKNLMLCMMPVVFLNDNALQYA